MAEVRRIRTRKRAHKHSTTLKDIFFFRSILEHKGKSLRISKKLLKKLFTDISEHLFAIK